MRAYKGFNKNEDGTLSCRGFVYEPGKTYKHEGEIKLCRSGFHACHELWQVWPFYPNKGDNEFWEVECGGDMIESEDCDGKFVCSEIRLVKKCDMGGIEKFGDVGVFSDGFALALNKEKHFFIDKNGKNVFGKIYQDVYMFRDGYALVSEKGKWNAINTKGEPVSKKWFDDICRPKCGLFHVINNGKDNYIDEKGNLLSDTWFDNATDFSCGTGVVWKDGCRYEIYKNGKLTKLKDEW